MQPTLLKSILKPAKLPPLHSLLNLWAIEDDAVIGVDLQMSFAYELTLPDIALRGEGELADYFQSVKNVLHSLPENVTMQFLIRLTGGDEERISQYQAITQPESDIGALTVAAKVEHLKNVFIQRKKYYLFITTYPDGKDAVKLKPGFVSDTGINYAAVTETMHRTRIARLKDAAQQITTGLSAAGASFRQLTPDQTLDLIYHYLNPSRSDILESKTLNPTMTLRSQVCFNACENNFDHIYLDGYYYRAVNLHIRPESVTFAMLDRMLSMLEPDCDISFSLTSGNQESLLHAVHTKGATARNISNASFFKKNYEAESLQQDATQLIEDVKTTFQRLYAYSLTVIIRERTLEQLTVRTNATLQVFRTFGECEGVIDDMNHLHLFASALPNHSHLNFRKHLFQTEAIAQMLPLFAEWQGCKTPRILFQTDDDQLLPIDLFDPSLSAKHGLILGQTGSGKSFTTNFLLTNFFIESLNNHIVIIDVGGSYRKLCSFFKGQYLEVEMSEKFGFNPFPSKDIAVVKASDVDYEIDADVISYLTNLVQKMLKRTDLSGQEQKIIENAIITTYKTCETSTPILGNLHANLVNYEGDEEDRKIAREFGKNLEIWTRGRFGKLINTPTTIDTTARLVVFDLQKLNEQPELQSIIFFLISSVIENKLKDKALRKIIVIDEGWKFFNDDVGSLLIQNLYRTARKFNAGVLSISQSPVDFLGTKAANAIISNSYIKYVLRLKTGYELLTQFGLNEQEINEVRELRSQKGKYSEVFLKFSEHSRVIKIEPSRVDYWICTTDPDDTQTEMKYRASHPDDTEAQILAGLAKVEE